MSLNKHQSPQIFHKEEPVKPVPRVCIPQIHGAEGAARQDQAKPVQFAEASKIEFKRIKAKP